MEKGVITQKQRADRGKQRLVKQKYRVVRQKERELYRNGDSQFGKKRDIENCIKQIVGESNRDREIIYFELEREVSREEEIQVE